MIDQMAITPTPNAPDLVRHDVAGAPLPSFNLARAKIAEELVRLAGCYGAAAIIAGDRGERARCDALHAEAGLFALLATRIQEAETPAAMWWGKPDDTPRVPLWPEPGKMQVPLTGAECSTLAEAYLLQAPGRHPVQEWLMVDRARRLSDVAAALDPRQFGHLRGAISPRVEGQA
jgi:hypothetical protein